MNFFEMCYELFTRMSKYHELSKDVENYNKIVWYLNNFQFADRKEIEKFIVDVRFDNRVYSAICQLQKVVNGPIRKLSELNPNELFVELQGEIKNVVLKGAYDSIKLLYNLDEQQSAILAQRIAAEDMAIFTEYKC